MVKRLLVSMIILGMLGCTSTLENPKPISQESKLPQNNPTSTAEDTLEPVPTIATPALVIPTPMATLIQPSVEPHPPHQNIFGIALNSIDEAGALAEVIQTGVGWIRKEFSWSRIEPAPGDRQWDMDLDQELIKLSSLNLQLIMLIGGTPGWALKEGFYCGAVAESQFTILGQFAYDLVKRYSVPPYNVHYWELWNEPDAAGVLGCWGDPSDLVFYGGFYYGQMLKVVYPRIKEADPTAQVLVGGLLLDCDPINPPVGKDCLPAHFLEGILASGAGEDFDGVSFHAYDYYAGNGMYGNPNWNSSSNTTGPVSIAKSRYLNDVLSNYGYGQKYLINTETAVFWGPNVMDPPCGSKEPQDMEVTKANYVVQSYAVAMAEGWKANIWYSAVGIRCSGLLNSDWSPKPVYYTYQFTEQKLGKAIFVRSITEFDGVMGFEYELPGRTLWVIWSLGGQTVTINLPRLPVEVNRVSEMGLPVKESNSASVSMGASPFFIEFER